jgi:hypothetical protein
MFQRRHYEWLAEFCGLEYRRLGARRDDCDRLAATLAARLREDNSRFKPERFMQRVQQVAASGGGTVIPMREAAE